MGEFALKDVGVGKVPADSLQRTGPETPALPCPLWAGLDEISLREPAGCWPGLESRFLETRADKILFASYDDVPTSTFSSHPSPLHLSIFHSMSHHHFNLHPCRDRGHIPLWQVETYSRPQSWNSDESGGHNYTQNHLSSKTMRFPQLHFASK